MIIFFQKLETMETELKHSRELLIDKELALHQSEKYAKELKKARYICTLLALRCKGCFKPKNSSKFEKENKKKFLFA